MSTMSDKTIVVLLRHNAYEMALKALRSIYCVGDVRVVLVDNGSTDNRLSDIRSAYKDLVVVENSDNLLYSAAYNAGIKKALSLGAEYINIAHDDSYDYTENYFSSVEEVFASDDSIGLVGSRCIGPSGLTAWGGENHPKLGVDMNTPTCGYTISKKAFDSIGMLDEKLGVYFEDLDFIQRLRDFGFRTKYIDSICFTHLGSDDATKRHYGWRFHYYRVRNLFWFMKKHRKHMSKKLVVDSIKRILPFHFNILKRLLMEREFFIFLKSLFFIVIGMGVGIVAPYGAWHQRANGRG